MENEDQEYLPSVSLEFLIERAKKSDKCHITDKVGKTHVFLKKGTAPVSKRLKVLPELDNASIPYDHAISFAMFFGFLGELMNWCKKNKNWVSGGFSERANEKR